MSAQRTFRVISGGQLESPSRSLGSGVVPRAVIRSEALSYQILRPRDAGPADLPLLGEAYELWSEVWRQTLLEQDGLTDVWSDDFTRQDEIGALFHQSECIGMTAYRWIDLSSPIHKDDSYFRAWPAAAKDAACAHGTRVCVGSNLTVAPAWRTAVGQSAKVLLMALAVDRFRQSQADVMVGTMRNDRGMDDLGYRLGFRPLAHDVFFHGRNVDLVAFYQQTCSRLALSPDTEAVIQTLRPQTR